MEVHAHSHTPRKKWTHYFWEFIMLFLAVIAGFYAENIREHKVEHKRGKEYLKSFLSDLRTDTAHYRELLDDYEKKLKVLEHNYECYSLIKVRSDFNQCLWKIIEETFSFPDLITEDRTLQQLKSSGALRLIPKQDADSITKYDSEIREQLQGERTGVQEAQSLLRNAYFELLNYDVAYKGLQERKFMAGSRVIDISDPAKIDRLFSILTRYQQLMEGQVGNISDLYNRAVSLINYFSGKYHFKD
ncbi:MAG TPA: hypothetical protein VMZ03_05445 [Chitinophagaceae bacterium]|nr:hypothetical protein [Chitinophagaceae bacterium]